MNKIKYILLWTVVLPFVAGCTEQRDLYILSSSLFVVKADWSKSTISPHGATALVYNDRQTVLGNPFMQPPAATEDQKVNPGMYDILVFNNLMFAPNDNEFDNIVFIRTERFDSFEAHATLNAKVSQLFRSDTREVIVNNPDIIAAATYPHKVIQDDREFVIKYEDGKKTGNYEGNHMKNIVEVTPVRLTRNVQVIVRVKNYKPRFAIYGTLRGFAQGVNLSTRQPVGAKATHAGFLINKVSTDPDHIDHHILTTDVFTSFGPWWNDSLGCNTYTLDILARYNGQDDAFSYSFNVTKYIEGVVTQWVERAIEVIKSEEKAYRNNGSNNGPVPKMDTIIIEVWLELPEGVSGDDEGVNVGVDDWGDVVVISVPIKYRYVQ